MQQHVAFSWKAVVAVALIAPLMASAACSSSVETSDTSPSAVTSSVTSDAPGSQPRTSAPAATTTSTSAKAVVPAYFREPCRDLMPNTAAFSALGMKVDNAEGSSVVASDGEEEADALARSQQTAIASCMSTGLSVNIGRFATPQLAADDLASSVRTSANPGDPLSTTTEISQIPGAILVANPGFGSAGIYWLSQPDTSVSLIANYDDAKVQPADVHQALVDAAVAVNGRVRP